MEKAEKPRPETEPRKEALIAFRAEMQELKEKEVRRELSTIHLMNVDPPQLTAEDMEVWRKIKDESITREDLARYSAPMLNENRGIRGDISRSQREFLEFIKNKAAIIFGRRQLKERKGL